VKVAVIVPCYNTGVTCVEVVRRAQATADRVLVVDDGSTDDTPRHIAASGAAFLRLPVNAGKGAALKAGLEEVLKGPNGLLADVFDCIVTIDGDGQHDPADIPRFVSRAFRDGVDLVISVRDLRRMPWKSRIGNRVARWLFLVETGCYIPDTQSGFRLLSPLLARALLPAVTWRRYETEAEILAKAVALGYPLGVVTIDTVYLEQNQRTHFDPLWDSMRVIAVLSRGGVTSLAVAVVGIATYVLALSMAAGNVIWANAVATLCAVATDLVMRRQYLFRVRGRFTLSEPARYTAMVLLNLLVTSWLLLALQRRGAHPVGAKVIAQLLEGALTFIWRVERTGRRMRQQRGQVPAVSSSASSGP
jgi:glycosyltransferase involved in cell wall biosynthesis